MSDQAITDINLGQPPTISGKQLRPWTDNEDLYSAGRIIISTIDQLCLDEVDEIFLDSLRALFDRLDENGEVDSLAIAQGRRLLIVWSERRCNFGNMIEKLTKASNHLKSLAAVLAETKTS